MGRKVHPIGFRLGGIRTWDSNWYAERNYTEQLHEDLFIRDLIERELTRAGISRVYIERSANRIEITIYTSKPGIVIGKQGSNVERLRHILEGELGTRVHLKIEEIKVPELDARLVAESIAEQLLRRVSYRRAMKHAAGQAMRRGAEGVKIRLGGRLGGAEMSRAVVEKDGRVPLHTLRADIDFASVHAPTTYGQIGVKVWIYRGDILPEREREVMERAEAAIAALTSS